MKICAMASRSDFSFLASRMRFIRLVYELKGAFFWREHKYIVCGGVHVAPLDDGIVPVIGHVIDMDVNDKGDD